MSEKCAEFRFFEELNDFLDPFRQFQTLLYRFGGAPAVKDPIEALGPPQPKSE